MVVNNNQPRMVHFRAVPPRASGLAISKSCRMTGGEQAWREGVDPHLPCRAAARAFLQGKHEVRIVASRSCVCTRAK